MKKFRILLFTVPVLLVAFAATARAQQAVTFPSGDSTAQALLYLPQGPGPHPALIVIHEWWGLNDWIKQEAAGYAAKGYVTLAVDLYRGQVATTPDLAHELSRGLPQDQGVRDLTAAVEWLEDRKDVKRDRIGAVGWCMGGGYALQLAIASPALRAVAVNYGSLATDKGALARIHAAVLGTSAARTTAFRRMRFTPSWRRCSRGARPSTPKSIPRPATPLRTLPTRAATARMMPPTRWPASTASSPRSWGADSVARRRSILGSPRYREGVTNVLAFASRAC